MLVQAYDYLYSSHNTIIGTPGGYVAVCASGNKEVIVPPRHWGAGCGQTRALRAAGEVAAGEVAAVEVAAVEGAAVEGAAVEGAEVEGAVLDGNSPVVRAAPTVGSRVRTNSSTAGGG